MAKEDPNPSQACDDFVCLNTQSDHDPIHQNIVPDSVVEEPDATSELSNANSAAEDRLQRGPWSLSSSPGGDLSADKRLLLAVLVLVKMILLRWYYTRRKRIALVKDQKYMVGFCSTTIDQNSSYHTDSNQPDDNGVTRSSTSKTPNATIRADHISEIREKQQQKLVIGNKRSHRQIHSQQYIRKRTLYHDLNHRAANDAYDRRMYSIAHETLLVQPQYGQIEQQARQVLIHEEEEVHRRTLLHEQDMEYQQSLQNDQHRTRQLDLRNNREMRRSRALDEARQRLAIAGIVPHCCDPDHDIKVRLLLPSGQKIAGSFSTKHSMGLIYDLALLALDTNKMLWSSEDGGNTTSNQQSDDGAEGIDAFILQDKSPAQHSIYTEIQKEWREIFYPFVIASSYPKRTYDNLATALENFGFCNQVALIVVVEFT